MTLRAHKSRPLRGGLIAVVCAWALLAPAGHVSAFAAGDLVAFNGQSSVYIDEPLQGGTLGSWERSGYNWQPDFTTVLEDNERPRSINTNNCQGIWPLCTAERNNERDSRWLTLTTDNTRDGSGEAATALHSGTIPSDLGVVLEYDQRVYRTNDGRMKGFPETQGGGDGIAVYLADADPATYGNSGVDVTPDESGGYGAGLGYSAVSDTGDNWCSAQQGVAGGYIGIGFDVYGNYQKADGANEFDAYVRATRPRGIANGHPAAFDGELANGDVPHSSRVPQSIGLRGSGVRFNDHPACDPNATSAYPGLVNAYGAIELDDPLVTSADFHTIFQVKWEGWHTAEFYAGVYTAPGQPGVAVQAEEVPAAQLPMGFDDPRGYVKFSVPRSISNFDFTYTMNGTSAGAPATGITQDVSLGPNGAYTPLKRTIGGYRWLAGTDNLSTYPNPTTVSHVKSNEATRLGAVIDNARGDSREYRRVRITLTPDGSGTRLVRVYWSEKLNVADDKCYSEAGAELPGRTANGVIDTCVDPVVGEEAGTWFHDRAEPLEYEEMFSYDLGDSDVQAELPSQFRLGFSASTGWAVNHHQIRNLSVTSVIDLEVEKQVAFIGDNTDATMVSEWLDEDTGTLGENVAYRIAAWNNGPSDVDQAYPATLTDGLEEVPFQNVDDVLWTAQAQGGAALCAAWNAVTVTCDEWVTELSGAGPLTVDERLRWAAPSRTTAPTAGISVTFVGAVSDGVESADHPLSGEWYDNVAHVAASVHGGPREDDLSNNSDDARIRVVPQLQVNKLWSIDDVVYVDGEQPDEYVAELEIDPLPDGVDEPEFGGVYSFGIDMLDNSVGIDESVEVPVGCSVDAAVTSVNGEEIDADLADEAYEHVLTASPALHVIELTNTVECQSLTLRKTVLNPTHALSAVGGPDEWILSATLPGSDAVINEAPSVEIAGVDRSVSLATSTTPVDEGSYQLQERPREGSADNLGAYIVEQEWSCTYPDPTDQDPDAIAEAPVTPDGVVTVPAGTDVTCEIVNATAEITVLKWAEASHFEAQDFTLEVRESGGEPSDPAALSAEGSSEQSVNNSTLVVAGNSYEISEYANNPHLPFLQKAFEQYVASAECPALPQLSDLENPACWSESDPQSVSVSSGEREIYRFVNIAPNAPEMPLTGGKSATMFFVVGFLVILSGMGGILLKRWRGRIHS